MREIDGCNVRQSGRSEPVRAVLEVEILDGRQVLTTHVIEMEALYLQ